MRKFQDKILNEYLATMRSKYRDTYYHSLRVSHLVKGICDNNKLPFDSKEVFDGALLHDIGKLLIPKEILDKPSKLTTFEFEKIKEHPQIGYEMLNGKVSNRMLNCILYHHERLDGSGYPYGLTIIPEESQLLAVCDSYDAMVAKRPYNSPVLITDAISNLLMYASKGKYNIKYVEMLAKLVSGKNEIKPVIEKTSVDSRISVI